MFNKETTYPPFPVNVPTAELRKIRFADLESGNVLQLLLQSCRETGFFLLDLRGSSRGEMLLGRTSTVFELAESLFKLDDNIKASYPIDHTTAYGYKAIGASKVDRNGTPDNCEFWGFGKDSILGLSASQDFPDIVRDYHTTIRSFVERAQAVCVMVLTWLEKSLNVRPGGLKALHSLTDPSTDQLRLLTMPPKPEGDQEISFLPHTDFGTITLLWNVLGRLQVWCAGNNKEEWQFVRPEPGCAVVNMGDAMSVLTGGRIRSSLHRVIPPPGAQGDHIRYSLAYFCRPRNGTLMKSVLDAEQPDEGRVGSSGAQTMEQWVRERAKVYQEGGEESAVM